MKTRQLKPSGTVVVVAIALVVGLEAPAMAHQAGALAHKISGSSIKPNTVTGKQVKESTLGTVPRAKLLTPLVWRPLTGFSNGWADGSATASNHVRPLGYAIDAQGLVHLRGALTNPNPGTAGTIALTLPAALASPTNIIYNIPIEASGYKEADLTITGTSVYLYDGDSTENEVESLSNLEGVVYQPK